MDDALRNLASEFQSILRTSHQQPIMVGAGDKELVVYIYRKMKIPKLAIPHLYKGIPVAVKIISPIQPASKK